MDDGVIIRGTTDADGAALRAVHLSAFGAEQGPEVAELVTALLADETARPVLSLVAEGDGLAIGHILFTQARLQPGRGTVSVRILAPLGVSSDRQRQGIGGALIAQGLEQLAESGVDLVFVLGHPAYYPKHGFRPAGALGFAAPYPIPAEHADAWMVRELRAGAVGAVTGTIQCAVAMDEPRHWRE